MPTLGRLANLELANATGREQKSDNRDPLSPIESGCGSRGLKSVHGEGKFPDLSAKRGQILKLHSGTRRAKPGALTAIVTVATPTTLTATLKSRGRGCGDREHSAARLILCIVERGRPLNWATFWKMRGCAEKYAPIVAKLTYPDFGLGIGFLVSRPRFCLRHDENNLD